MKVVEHPEQVVRVRATLSYLARAAEAVATRKGGAMQ